MKSNELTRYAVAGLDLEIQATTATLKRLEAVRSSLSSRSLTTRRAVPVPVPVPETKTKKRRVSRAARKAISERMVKYWAGQRKAAAAQA